MRRVTWSEGQNQASADMVDPGRTEPRLDRYRIILHVAAQAGEIHHHWGTSENKDI